MKNGMSADGARVHRSTTSTVRDLLAGLVWALLVSGTLLLLALHRLLPDGPEEWTFDWRAAHFSKRAEAQRSDIAVLLVTEDSVARYASRSPVDRFLLAELVRAIDAAEPKIIGLDFIFDRPTEPAKDHALAEAVRTARTPIVLGALDGRARGFKDRNFEFQQAFLAKTGGRAVGHLFFAGQSSRLKVSEHVIRAMASPYAGSPYNKSFAELLVEHDGVRRGPATPLISWLLPPNDGRDDLFVTIPVREHEPSLVNLAEHLLSKEEAAALKGKIVLVGGQFVDRDQHLTPLWVADRERTPGVLIHAQIVAQLLDGRAILMTPAHVEFVALTIVALVGFYLGHRWGLNRFRQLVNVGGVAVLIIVSVSLFWAGAVIVPSTTLLFAWLAGIAGGHHYDSLVRRHIARRASR